MTDTRHLAIPDKRGYQPTEPVKGPPPSKGIPLPSDRCLADIYSTECGTCNDCDDECIRKQRRCLRRWDAATNGMIGVVIALALIVVGALVLQ